MAIFSPLLLYSGESPEQQAEVGKTQAIGRTLFVEFRILINASGKLSSHFPEPEILGLVYNQCEDFILPRLLEFFLQPLILLIMMY